MILPDRDRERKDKRSGLTGRKTFVSRYPPLAAYLNKRD